MYFYVTSAGIFLAAAIILEIIFKEKLFHSFKERILWVLIFLLVGAPWDALAIMNKHWIFPGQGILGIYIGVIPIEEFLWYMIIPYFALTVFKAIHSTFDKK